MVLNSTVVLTQFLKLLQTRWMMLQSSGIWCFVLVSCQCSAELAAPVFKVKALFFTEDRSSRCLQNDCYHLTDSLASDTCRLQFWYYRRNGSCFHCWCLIPINCFRIFQFGAHRSRQPGTRDSVTVAEALLYIIAIKFTTSCIVVASFFKG